MVLVFVLWLIVSRFCLWGWSFVWFVSPSSPDPCLVFCMCPSFFLCLVGFVAAVFSLSLSQALGKPKPIWFGFPLVFSWPRSPSTTRTSRTPPTPRFPPAPVCVFIFFDVARLSGGCWLWVAVFVLGLSLSFLVVRLHCLLACTNELERGGGL